MNEPKYHYTTIESLIKMGITGKIFMSGSFGDAAFGYGLYVTSLPPSVSTEYLLLNNYDGGMASPIKTSCYLKFVRNQLCFQRCPAPDNRDIYLYPSNQPISIYEADAFGFRLNGICYEYPISFLRSYSWNITNPSPIQATPHNQFNYFAPPTPQFPPFMLPQFPYVWSPPHFHQNIIAAPTF